MGMKEIIRLFSAHGTFVQPEVVEYIASKEDPYRFASLLLKELKEYPLVLTLDDVKTVEKFTSVKPENVDNSTGEETVQNQQINDAVMQQDFLLTPGVQIEEEETKEEAEENQEEEDEEGFEVIPVKSARGWKPLAREYEPEVTVIKDVTGKSTCEGNTTDFIQLFRSRYEGIKRLFQSQRRALTNPIPLDKIKKGFLKEMHLIGIVRDVHTTAKGHRIIEIEDERGVATLLVPNNDHQLLQQAQEIVVDEIISVTGTISRNGDLIVVKSLAFPDIHITHEKHVAEVPLYAAFLADTHIGSKMFLSDQWKMLLKWLNGNVGNSRQRDVAGKIKYLVVPGDTVDGIGIYPNQEKELSIKDISKQYETLAQQLQLFPDHITIIVQPGNHDAVRPAEPQPSFEKEIQDLFSGRDIRFVGNPCYLKLHGVEVLSYHGLSLLDYATNIPSLKYNEPIEIMKIALRKRHLAPIYGGYTPLAPEHSDYMIIDRIPDIFVTGHVHLSSIGEYRGVTLINASSWQAQTSYQRMLNFIPDPAKLPIVDLKTGSATTMDFTTKVP
ncbi:MAG TPA: DNA-directed DNA polymerase II small subunit [Thermoplasmata archaeon]|nr:DNA-directed DNA polymerase II small subunit [Thermoplasmata archaeon]